MRGEAANGHASQTTDPPEGVLVLGDEHGAAQRARRWVTQRLEAEQLGNLAHDAELIVSELVTNALVHAGPPAELALRVVAARVRLEVRDRSDVVPVRSQQGQEAMTGRGLHVIEALAQDWGVESLPTGKSVWTELEDGAGPSGPDASADELMALWGSDDAELVQPASAEPRYVVGLGEVPIELLLSAKAHVDDLVREFTLAASGARTGATPEVPSPLAELLETVVSQFSEPRRAIKQQALAAAGNARHVYLKLSLPLSAADAGEAYLRALDEADEYCRAARLLTLESPPRHRVFRHWYVGELIKQLRHAASGSSADPPPGQSFEERVLSEIDSLSRAERAAERTAQLHALSSALAGAVTPEEVANAVVAEGVSALGASGGGLLLTGSGGIPDVAGTVGYDETTVARLRSQPPDVELPARVARRTGEAVWVESLDERDHRFPLLGGLEPGTLSLCAVPLVTGTRLLGALRFSFDRPRLFGRDERDFVQTMAAQAAQALDRALLHHQRYETARQLQRSLLPPDLPNVPGVDLATRYDTAEANDIGGDFYDVLGTGQEWTLIIGDVRGKGVEAAALTGLVRHTVRAGALRDLAPDRILRLLNDAFLEQESPESFCTAVCGHLSVRDGHACLRLASGGHPAPLVLRADGTVESTDCDGMLVGSFPDADYGTVTVDLRPGDLVLFYTDGLSEARRDGRLFGVRRIKETLTSMAGRPAASVVQELHSSVEEYQTGQRDDRALLALRLDPLRS